MLIFPLFARLVILDLESNAVRLVHYTTEEYFEKNPLSPFGIAQEGVAKACIAYLSSEAFRQGPCTDNETLRLRFRRYPFLRYAAVNWGNHARGQPEDSCKEDILQFLSNENMVNSARQAASVYGVEGDISGLRRWSEAYLDDVSMLSTAASFGLTKIVDHLIQSGHDIESADNTGATALYRAAQDGHTDTVKILLAAGADIDRVVNLGTTALIEAASNGHEDTVAALLQSNPDIEARTLYGQSALYCAVYSGHPSIVELLLKKGANIETEDNLFVAALHSPNAAMVSYINDMIDKRKYIDEIRSSLVAYISRDRWPRSIEIINKLLEEGADLTYRVEGGETPIHLAARRGLVDPVEFLLRQGVDPNLRTEEGYTPLHWASFRGSLEVIDILLRNGAEMIVQNNAGETVLHTCMHYASHEEIVALLLARGAPANMTDCNGRSALHEAARKGFKYNVHSLLHNGANIDIQDNQGWTALQHAASAGHDDIVQQLLERKPILGHPSYRSLLESARLRDAIKAKDIPLAQRLLGEESISVDSTSRLGRTALHHAAKNGLREIVKGLIQRGASVNATIPDSTYNNWVGYLGHIPHEAYECAWITPLHNAVGEGHVEVTEILLRSGADLNAAGGPGYTPLSVAVHAGHANVVKILLDHGADFRTKDRSDSPSQLSWSVLLGHEDIARLLLEHGADEERHTEDIKRALAFAVERKFTKTVDLLKSYGITIGQH